MHAKDISQRHRVRRDVCARIIPACNHRRGDERDTPVLGLQLKRVHARPDGQHRLAREAAANLGEAKVKGEARREDARRQRPRVLGDLCHVAAGVGRVGEPVEQRLQVGEERAGDVVDLGAVKRRRREVVLPREDGVDDARLPVEKGLAEGGWLTYIIWKKYVSEIEGRVSQLGDTRRTGNNNQTHPASSPCPAPAP